MTEKLYRTQLRLPMRVYEQLKQQADESGRSLNAEIAYRLENSLGEKALRDGRLPTERQKVELLLDFESWLQESQGELSEKGALKEFCRLYNGGDPDYEQVETVYGIEEVTPRFLRDLALACRRYARESPYISQHLDPIMSQRHVPEVRKAALVKSYLCWCETQTKNPMTPDTLNSFCREYHEEMYQRILGIPTISPGYLEELVIAWLHKLPMYLSMLSEKSDFMREAIQIMREE
ncbi:Arc family DNA-binding protein [Chromobacterium haemolyticum]|uniref:Arc family DNA-binding protein n=1 Tax=Chromobacterium haemolyticum TaxID=394935 RepID=UPI00307D77B8